MTSERAIEATLSSVSEVFTDGDWIESKDQSPSGIRLIQTGNVGIGEFKDRAEKARYISKETFHRLRCEEIYEGDCLISRLPDPVGRACIIPPVEDRLITAVDCTIIRFNKTKICPDYFRYYSQTSSYLDAVESACTGATRQRISRSKLGEIKIPLQPLPEQKRIVAILDEAFEGINTAIANTEKNLANARELFNTYLKSIFTPSASGWETKTLGEVCEMYQPKTIGGKDFIEDGPFPVYGANGVIGRYDKFNHEESQLLITCRGATCGSVNMSAPKSWVTGNAMVVRPRTGEIDLEFLEFAFRGGIDLSGAITGSAQPQITRSNLSPIKISYPTQATEQKRLALALRVVNEKAHLLNILYRRKLDSLRELKQSILRKAFAGELTTRTAADTLEAAE